MLFVLGLVSCQTTSIPIDDAYYSPAVEPAAVTTLAAAVAPEAPAAPAKPSTTVEYINVQDTTVTVRIKK